MTYELQGIIKQIYPPQTFASGFTKREFVVTTDQERYPQDIKFEVVKERCTLLDKFAEGARIKVAFDIRGSEFNGKYYVNLNAWKVQPAEGGAEGGEVVYEDFGSDQPVAARVPKKAAPQKSSAPDYGPEEDIPF